MMGEQSPASNAVAAALCSQQAPDVTVETAADGSDEAAERVTIEGTMYHSGLNRNAWGLSAEGAQRIADSLEGRDLTASHPFIRNGVYDRAVAGGQGMPIGTVTQTDVTTVDSADALDGGEYTATYKAEVTEPDFARRYHQGTLTQDGYGVSIGIYGNPDSATCSACGEAMGSDDCGHSRGEEVEASDDETKVAGPIYDDGQSDHLASVYMPAYSDADADVSDASQSPQPRQVGPDKAVANMADENPAGHPPQLASAVLASPFDSTETAADDDDDGEFESASDDGLKVRVANSNRQVRLEDVSSHTPVTR